MGMNHTPVSDRVHIGFFGRRNAGKSSVLNAVTGQDLAVVSEVLGTTTDPVYKSMELLPLGPVVMIDTPGIDDEGALGSLRVRKSFQVLNKTDIAVLVIDGSLGLQPEDRALLERIQDKKIPCVAVCNKADLGKTDVSALKCPVVFVSAHTGEGIRQLKECLAILGKTGESCRKIAGDLVEPLDFVVLVVPVDASAPKGRLILPQQQTIRDLLETGAMTVVVKDTELADTLKSLGRKPKLVITDSQAFARVSAETPEDILLTSFSILFARYKGDLESVVKGVTALDGVGEGDKILIAEGCTHHRQCEDIGTVKLPGWIRNYTGAEPEFVFVSGTEFPDDLSPYKMIVHCGGCMLNQREMEYRMKCAADQGIPMTNYGILIAYTQGILKRSVEPFPRIAAMLRPV